MVSPYCTFLFSRKEIITFSEVAFISAHCNWMIRCIVIAQGYWPWNAVNATKTASLSKAAIKTLNQNIKFVQTFFYQSFGCPKAKIVSRTRRQPHSPDVNHNTISSNEVSRNEVGSRSLIERISWIRARNLLILSVTCYPTVRLSPKVY